MPIRDLKLALNQFMILLKTDYLIFLNCRFTWKVLHPHAQQVALKITRQETIGFLYHTRR